MTKTEKEILKKLEEQLELHNLPKDFYIMVLESLKSFKYKISEKDSFILSKNIMKVKQDILNHCNITTIPIESLPKFSEMVCGDFLFQQKQKGQLNIDGLDLSTAITSLSEGDVKVAFDSSDSDSSKLDTLLENMMSIGGDFDCYKKLKW